MGITSSMPAAELATMQRELGAAARAAGRGPTAIRRDFQVWLRFGRDEEEAVARLRRSQHFRRTEARDPAHSEEAALADFRAGNLLGRPGQVIDQLRAYEAAGITHVGVVFVGDTLKGLPGDMEVFAQEVMPAF